MPSCLAVSIWTRQSLPPDIRAVTRYFSKLRNATPHASPHSNFSSTVAACKYISTVSNTWSSRKTSYSIGPEPDGLASNDFAPETYILCCSDPRSQYSPDHRSNLEQGARHGPDAGQEYR